ncbi:MAG: hypothetical protein WD696_04005 [Bryobacteraceae bacterium]
MKRSKSFWPLYDLDDDVEFGLSWNLPGFRTGLRVRKRKTKPRRQNL